jgi:hypothetical protein
MLLKKYFPSMVRAHRVAAGRAYADAKKLFD